MANDGLVVEKHGVDFAIQCLANEMQWQEQMHLACERDIATLRANLAEAEQTSWMAQNNKAACKAAMVALGHVASD